MIRALVTLWLLLWAFTAQAQEGMDGHGVVVAASDGDAADLLYTWRPERQQAGSFGAEAIFEYASDPLVLKFYRDGELSSTQALVDDLFTMNLGGSWAPHERLALGAAFPLFLSGWGPDGPLGFAVGDLRLSAAGGLVLPDAAGRGFGLSLVPYVDLPTGAEAVNLGRTGAGGGLILPVGLAGPRLALTANLGAGVDPALDLYDLNGGPHGIVGLGTSAVLSDALALRAEAHVEPNLRSFAANESPGEAALSLRLRTAGGGHLTVGGSAAITPGVGAAFWRVFLGAGFAAKAPLDPDLDGFIGADDACPRDAEVFNDWKDDDGCPDALATLGLTVRDSEGVLLPDLDILDGDELLGRTDAEGALRIEGLEPGRELSLVPDHFHLQPMDAQDLVLAEGDNPALLEPSWLPGRVVVVTRSQQGPITNAAASFEGPAEAPGGPVTDGRRRFFLAPGDWRVLVSAPSFETEQRDLSIGPDETAEVIIEVILEPELRGDTWLRVVTTDGEGLPVPEVSITSAQQLLGISDANGELRLTGLQAGVVMELGAEHFFTEPFEPVTVELSAGRNDMVLQLRWLPGRVKVITRSQQGPITSATARFEGPRGELDGGGAVTDGERLFYLSSGHWEVFVSAPEFDVEQRSLDILPDETSVVVVEVELKPETVREEQDAIVLLDNIYFDHDRWSIRPESEPLVRQVAVVLKSRPDLLHIEVRGHTDSRGSETYNLYLSQKRVEAVVARLVELGIEPGRLKAQGFGESQPVASNDDAQGRELNRRVEFVIVE